MLKSSRLLTMAFALLGLLAAGSAVLKWAEVRYSTAHKDLTTLEVRSYDFITIPPIEGATVQSYVNKATFKLMKPGQAKLLKPATERPTSHAR